MFQKIEVRRRGRWRYGDCKIAYNLYKKFFKDYNVFFSEESLNNIAVREFEPNIYYALYTAKVMLIVCSKREYLESQWVKNEWNRFKMMSDNTAQIKAIIPIFIEGFTPELLPYELRSFQGYSNDMFLIDNLESAVKEIINPTDKQAEFEATIAAKMQGQFEAQMQAQMEVLEKQLYDEIQNESNSIVYSIPQGTKVITELQIENKENLTRVVIPNSVTTIGDEAFSGCSGLTSITMPNNKVSIGNYAFCRCSGLTSIIIPEGITSIPNEAFKDCTSLLDIKIPDTVTSIGHDAFNGCSSLINIKIPNIAKSLILKPFANCTALKSVVAPAFIISGIDKTNLQTATITRGDITSGSFEGCSRLTNVTIGEDVTSISMSAFRDCDSLKTVNWDAINCTKKDSLEVFNNCKNITTINIGNKVKAWPDHLFAWGSKIKDV